MDKIAKYKIQPMLPIVWVVAHAALGVSIAQSAIIASLWCLLIFVIGSWSIIKNQNLNEEAAMWGVYVAISDVPLRACGGAIIWEVGKIGIVFFLLLGLLVEKKKLKKTPIEFLILFLLLIPGVINTLSWSERIREDITFNLSGIVCLLVSVKYFNRRHISYHTLKSLFTYSILPVISLAMVLFYRTPDIDTIEFTSSANFAMSGGFGPNQVATILGYGWMIILLMICMKEKVIFSRILTYALMLFILYRSLFTFSRGGNLAAILALVAFVGVYSFSRHKRVAISNSIITLLTFSILLMLVVNSINTLSGGMFENRLSGKDSSGQLQEDITSGRENIIELEYELFKNNPMGVGVGGSSYYRMKLYHDEHASHNEFGRLLSEHGILGIIIILILIFSPISFIVKLRGGENKAYCLMFLVLCLASMMHSGCRTALPEFLYGLSFIYIIQSDNEGHSIYRQ